MTQNKKYFITINNQVDDIAALYDVNRMEYFAACMETAPTTGHVHFHILVIYNQRRRLDSVRRDFPGANVQVAKGTFCQVLDYLTKEGDLCYEQGLRPSERRRAPPTATEIRFLDMVEQAKKGQLNRETLLYARYRSYFDMLDVQHCLKFTWKGELANKNLWIWGPTGTGKSLMGHQFVEENHLTIYSIIYYKNLFNWK